MTTAAVIQARWGSSRLPGKVLRHVGDSTMLSRVVTRLRRASTIDRIVVATTIAEGDDAVAAEAAGLDVDVVRGDEFDVLARYGKVLEAFPDIDVVVRVTADCPFVDPDVVDEVVTARRDEGLDFVANRLPPPTARTFPVGLDVEVATRAALLAAVAEATAPHHREHVMPFLYESGDRFAFRVIDLAEDLSSYRWTVDTPEDLQAVNELARLAGPEPFTWREVLAVARAHPWIGQINGDRRQKDVSEVDSRWGVEVHPPHDA
jgi:spore coat polysaccharide biosynthesis protein SpsF